MDTVIHAGSDRVRRRVTLLMETTPSPITSLGNKLDQVASTHCCLVRLLLQLWR